MSLKKFSPELREALYEAFDGKCAYTSQLLDPANYHIDHIIPEKIANNKAEMAALLDRYGLPQDFDINGVGNLLPCHPKPNLQKKDNLFSEESVHFYLNIASSKIERIEKNLKKIQSRTQRGKALLLIQSAIQHGSISEKDIRSLFDKSDNEIFRLIIAIGFTDKENITDVRKTEIIDLKNLHVKLGANDFTGVTLTHDQKGQKTVYSCNEYHTAISEGFYAQTTFDIKMAAFFEHQCGVLNALETAKLPRSSFIEDPRVGIVDLSLIPIQFFPYLEEEPKEKKTYQDMIDEGEFQIKFASQKSVVVESQGMGQSLIEVCRADFTDSGFEQILLLTYAYAIGGTLGYGGVSILGRTKPEGPFEIIQL